MDSTALTSILAAIGVPVSGVFGAWLNHQYNQRKAISEDSKIQLDDGAALRKDLLQERKDLLAQLLSERTFFTERMTAIEVSYTKKIESMEARIGILETANHKKDETILAQQKKIDEQEFEIHSQKQLIEVLQSEVKELKNVSA